ncbi:MAG: YebC/PmpR family DNA-binding transcriptional regulator [Phycisphaeraceae bacterium]|nr:YebC/PmpR family DNA-binding transcriptional regulator [Phycisphaeraceae bacterium]
MAGHSKWHNIKHRKAAVDKKRGKIWTKCAKAIIVAAKTGGPDPASNLSLRYAIDEARYANMPRDTIERAIKKGAGELGGDNYEPVRYEGYGPGGVAIIVDALTDNRTRTVGDLRLAFGKYGGNLGNSGCVGYMFEAKGQIIVSTIQHDESDRKAKPIPRGELSEKIMEAAINAGADDIEEPETGEEESQWTILTPVPAFQPVKEALEAAKIKIAEAQIAMVPTMRTQVRGEDAKRLLALIDAVEDLDDVQKVWANFDLDESEVAALGG